MNFDRMRAADWKPMSQLLLMLLLGVVLVYFIMVAQFQSLKSPFIVMFTIPLAFTGGFMALLLCGMLTGAFTGLCAQLLLERIRWK